MSNMVDKKHEKHLPEGPRPKVVKLTLGTKGYLRRSLSSNLANFGGKEEFYLNEPYYKEEYYRKKITRKKKKKK